jgi:hypothetical protein
MKDRPEFAKFVSPVRHDQQNLGLTDTRSKQKSIYMDGVMSGIIFSTHQSSTSLPNLEVLKLRAVIPLVTIFDCLASPM